MNESEWMMNRCSGKVVGVREEGVAEGGVAVERVELLGVERRVLFSSRSRFGRVLYVWYLRMWRSLLVQRPVSAELVIGTFDERPVVERSINSVIGRGGPYL